MKRLIVNADDFGMTHGINRAILLCHRTGIVTSTTLMANGAALPDAIAKAKQTPTLGVGCHVVLLDGEPLLEAEKITSLLKPSGEPYVTIGEFAPRALLGRFNAAQVEAETRAQFEEIQQTGIELTHFDAHKHAQMFPALLRPMLRAAQRLGIPACRNPFEPAGLFPLGARLRNKKFAVRSAEVAVLRLLRHRFRTIVREHGLKTPDGSIGIAATGTMTLATFETMLSRLPEGTWELCSHPGFNDAELDSVRTMLRASREAEMELLSSPEARALLTKYGVELTSYKQFVAEA
jgi:hopanoid biosynthesis associated protein HpnK